MWHWHYAASQTYIHPCVLLTLPLIITKRLVLFLSSSWHQPTSFYLLPIFAQPHMHHDTWHLQVSIVLLSCMTWRALHVTIDFSPGSFAYFCAILSLPERVNYGCTSLLLPRLPNQWFSNGQGNLGSLCSNKQIPPMFVHCYCLYWDTDKVRFLSCFMPCSIFLKEQNTFKVKQWQDYW